MIDIEAWRNRFGRMLDRIIRWRYAVVAVSLLLLISAFWYAGRYMDFILFSTQTADRFYVLAELAQGRKPELKDELLHWH